MLILLKAILPPFGVSSIFYYFSFVCACKSFSPWQILFQYLCCYASFFSPGAALWLQSAVRAINERILSVLDRSGSGRVDVGMFFAVLAPLCGGPVEKRKRLVFDVLRRRVSHPREGVAPNADVKYYMKLLRAIYLPTQVQSKQKLKESLQLLFYFLFYFLIF